VKWFGVVNPHAGAKGSPYSEVVSEARRLGFDCTFVESESGEHIGAMVETAIGSGVTGIVSVGGDGTANLVLNAIMASNTNERFTMGIVSSGSGSDFVRTFGHKVGIREGMSRIAGSGIDVYPVDIGLVSGDFGDRFFLNALTSGVTAASVAKAGSLPRWVGSTRYTAAFWIALWSFPNAEISVSAGRSHFEEDAITVVVANGQFFGGGLNIAPRSVLGDGKMDVQVFRGPRRQAFSVMPRVKMGTHLTHKSVQRFTGAEIEIDVPMSWPVEVDGEILGWGPVTVEVVPRAIDIVI
jgi:diacylglycerol kinase (ATP)